MSNVSYLPTRGEREWEEVRNGLQKMLNESGASEDMCREIIERMRVAWNSLNKEYNFHVTASSIEDVERQLYEQLGAAIHELTSIALRDRFLVEVELYLCRHGTS